MIHGYFVWNTLQFMEACYQYVYNKEEKKTKMKQIE